MTPIEAAITRLVQAAPALDAGTLAVLLAELRADRRPLALAIANVTELVAAGKVDAGIALPALAMACATLCDPAAGEREHEAARYEIETLLPNVRPDVPLTSLRKR